MNNSLDSDSWLHKFLVSRGAKWAPIKELHRDGKSGQEKLQHNHYWVLQYIQKYSLVLGFPGSAVVKNPPANAGDKGSRALVQEDPTCCGATKPVRHNY